MSVDPVRSALMSRIRGRDTRPEIRLRRRLWSEGLRYRLGLRIQGGRPDLVFPGPRVVVYVDGCFWHGCPDHYVRPRSRTSFWAQKLASNVARDRRQTLKLENAGWTVCRFWEHQIWEEIDQAAEAVRAAVQGEDRVPDRPRWQVVEVVPLDDSGERERRVLRALRDAEKTQVVEQDRSTKKWREQ